MRGKQDQEVASGTCTVPLMADGLLAMTSAGARGPTLEEMEQVLHLPPNNPHELFDELLKHLNSDGRDRLRPYELSIANPIWAMKDSTCASFVLRSRFCPTTFSASSMPSVVTSERRSVLPGYL